MKIVILGSGNVAYHLAKAFVQKKIEVVQLFGRNKIQLQNISSELEIPFSTQTLAPADIYIICVSDDAIELVSKTIINKNALVAHTSGSVPLAALSGNYRKAVFYPLQTFSKDKKVGVSQIPIFIETENKEDEDTLSKLAGKISTKVAMANSEKRKYIHLTAVFVSNFVNHLFAKAYEICQEHHLPFEYFLPLIDETIEKIHQIKPKDAQTGPARRNDKDILLLQEQLLTDDESLKIYKIISESIMKMYRK